MFEKLKALLVDELQIDEADITCDGAIPGDEISADAKTLHISAKTRNEKIKKIRVYADDKVIVSIDPDTAEIDMDITLPEHDAKNFIRVEMFGETEITVLCTTPFYIR